MAGVLHGSDGAVRQALHTAKKVRLTVLLLLQLFFVHY